MADDDTIFLPPEAADKLRTNARTLERWRTNGTGPAFVKIGRRVGYTGRALREYVSQQTRTITAEPK